jgi:hypothetical protein
MGENMIYRQAYLELFNAITDIIEELKQIQIKAEALIIEAPDKNEWSLVCFPEEQNKNNDLGRHP